MGSYFLSHIHALGGGVAGYVVPFLFVLSLVVFFHELGHILLHRKKRAFIVDNAADDLSDRIIDPEMQGYEAEANQFAADTLIPPLALSEFLRARHSARDISSDAIHDFAEAVGVGPGVVVGRLQHDGILKAFQGNAFKQNLNWRFEEDA